MLRWILTVACAGLVTGAAQDNPARTAPPAQRPVARPTTQPATQPAAQPGTQPTERRSPLRSPQQAAILKDLIAREDRPRPVPPGPEIQPTEKEAVGADGRPLLPEGTFIVERPGRLLNEGGRAVFMFHVDGDDKSPRSLPILESQLLEAMERQAEAGPIDFIVSGEVTRYRGANYLLLRKVLRRTSHGNLGPE